MNEAIFFGHLCVILFFTFSCLRLGKEALVAASAVLAIAGNFFVLKQVDLFGLNVTASDAYAIGSMLSLNLLHEYHGAKVAHKGMVTTFLWMILFGLFAQFHLLYTPSIHDVSHGAYSQVLSAGPRIVVASVTAYVISQYLNARLFGALKRVMPGASLGARSTVSLMVAQLVDTFIFAYAGLWGVVHSPLQIALVGFAIKVIVIGTAAPLTNLSKRMTPNAAV